MHGHHEPARAAAAALRIFILFASAVGMVALAGGLAFGLGGRETAAQIVNKQ
jgi:hypothetical protein